MMEPNKPSICRGNHAAAFIGECTAMFMGRCGGNLWPYLYGSPKAAGDPVCGALLYERLLAEEKGYYLYEDESRLIEKRARDIAAVVGIDATVIDLGTGGEKAVHRKTLPILTALTSPRGYVAVDISESLLGSCLSAVRSALPKLYVRGLCCDFSNLGDTLSPHEKPIFLFLGSTIGNTPPKECCAFMRKIHDLVYQRGLFIVGYDTNQDRDSLMRAYFNQYTARFVSNVLWRIRRDLNAFELDPGAFHYEPEWDPSSYDFRHMLVAKKALRFQIGNETIHLEASQKIHIASSYKYPTSVFQAMAFTAGLNAVSVFLDSAKRMAIHVFEAG